MSEYSFEPDTAPELDWVPSDEDEVDENVAPYINEDGSASPEMMAAYFQGQADVDEAHAQHAQAEFAQQQAALQQVEAIVTAELEQALEQGEISTVPDDALQLVAGLASNAAWCREHGVEQGSNKSIALAARQGFAASAPSDAQDELAGTERWLAAREAGFPRRAPEGWSK